ncbi:major facilitator superfamily domain-containing protein [Lineolata rhizophorae]|uniref:Major facilitator superfamily domain-containing protein n=1 Tax=Lineolata rhizophorae TaxID=578093 RepID=A0A6A6P7D9_9PEZI|nr:major facilitator superfamily domain-containing protein [Lineolata rhizophorae]
MEAVDSTTLAVDDTTNTAPTSGEKAATTNQDHHDEPEWPHEWRAWGCLIGCFFLMFNSWGLVNAFGTFMSFYKQHFLSGQSDLRLNLIGALECFEVLALSAVMGRLLDAGYARLLIGVGGALVTLGMFLLGVVQESWSGGERFAGVVGFQGLLLGLGMACLFVASSQVVATWFHHKKAFAIGVVASGASVAGFIYPMMTKFLLGQIGFNKAVYCVAAVVGFTALCAWLLAVPSPAHITRKPEKWFDRKLTVWVDLHAFQNKAYAFMVAAIAFMFFGFYAVFFNLEEWAAVHGFGKKDSVPGTVSHVEMQGEVKDDAIRTFWLLAIMNISSSIGRVGSAFASEKFGAVLVHSVCTAIASVLVLALWMTVSSVGMTVAFVILFGIFSGVVIGLPPASVANILGKCRKQQSKLGQWVGMMYTIAAIPALLGPLIAGQLVTSFNSYRTVQIWSGICLGASAACMFASWVCLRRQTATSEGRDPEKGNISGGSTLMDPSRDVSKATLTPGMCTPMSPPESVASPRVPPTVVVSGDDDIEEVRMGDRRGGA